MVHHPHIPQESPDTPRFAPVHPTCRLAFAAPALLTPALEIATDSGTVALLLSWASPKVLRRQSESGGRRDHHFAVATRRARGPHGTTGLAGCCSHARGLLLKRASVD